MERFYTPLSRDPLYSRLPADLIVDVGGQSMSSRANVVKLATALSGDLGSLEFVFDHDDVVQLLKIAIEHEGSQIAFAKRHHIDRANLNMVLNGKRAVTDGVAEAIGLRKVYMAK
jgi:hypothetical protein